MPYLTKLFGVTFSDADRNLAREPADIEEITQRSLMLQANSAAEQHRTLARGTHAKGVCARAQFEVFDVAEGRDPVLAARLAKGMFAKPGMYPAVVRFGNADPKNNSDFKADVRSLSFSVDLTKDGTVVPDASYDRQDFSLQNTTTLPINDSPAFLAIMKLLTASNPAAGL
jgi:catalase